MARFVRACSSTRPAGVLSLALALLLVGVSTASGAQREITFEGVPRVASIERLARELLLANKVLKPSELNTDITAFETDANSRSGRLLIVRLDDPTYCGTLGCLTFVFVSHSGGWKPIVARNFHRLWIDTSDLGPSRLITDDLHGNKVTTNLAK